MIDKKHQSAPGNNRILIICILAIIAIAGSWITYYLATFDLNDYRNQVERKLSSMLSLSVKIGDMSYELHGSNLALDIAGLRIGDPSSQLEISAPELTVDLKWLGLIQHDFSISTINLVKPVVKVRQRHDIGSSSNMPAANYKPILIDQALLYNTRVDALTFTAGQIEINSLDKKKPQKIQAININGDISNLSLGSMSQLAIEGDLFLSEQKKPSQWQIQGQATLAFDETRGLVPQLNLDLHCKSLDLQNLSLILNPPDTSISMAGSPDIDLMLTGSYPEQLDFQIKASSRQITLQPGKEEFSPIVFSHLVASGQYYKDNTKKGIKNLSLQIDESRLAGQIEWQGNKDSLIISTAIANSKLAVAKIKKWLPDFTLKKDIFDDGMKDKGSVHIQAAQLSYTQTPRSSPVFQIEKLSGELQNIAWEFKDTPTLKISSLPFDFDNSNWRINNALLQMGSIQVAANGKGTYSPEIFHVTSLDFVGDLSPQEMIHEWYIPKGALTTEGKIAINGHLEGNSEKLAIDFQADLSHLSLNHPAGLKLKPGKEDKLAIHATVLPGKINLDHGSIKWSAAKGHLSGQYRIGELDSLEIDALLSIDDLTRIAESLPLLGKIELEGQADLSISQRGNPEKNRPEMVLTVRDAGLKATRHIANLKNINGRIDVEPGGLHTKDLSVQLGESLLTVNAKLTDFTNPQLILDVKSPAVRAQDIIFYSDSAVLRDVVGRIEIDRSGLRFSPVTTRLDNGTDASVSGTIEFKKPYPVSLDITSDYAVISEVIGLWAGGSRASRKTDNEADSARSKSRQKTSITIHAQVKNGDLYGMKFREATGTIKPTRESLTIHPLDFSVGEGYCNAQVITEFRSDSPALLRISGHAEDVDALEIYRELLNQKSIVRGKLRGDFYLTGEIGSNYLPSSYGRFNVQIRNGVLHQFPILSKIFSLLNVSQIFALQLPDMDLEGMPFNNLEGNLRLDSGVLASNDLKIQSEAMNQAYIGELNLINKEIDLTTSIHPLGTVDKLVSRIPVAGWLLTGDDQALLTAHFRITGKTDSVSVQPKPLDSLSEPTLGLLRRTLELPFKLAEDPEILWGGQSKTTDGEEQ